MKPQRYMTLMAFGLAFIAAAAQARSPVMPGRSAVAVSEVPSDPVLLAARYESGETVRQDYGRALELYCQGALRGDPMAFYRLGWMYLNGRGVARNDATAAMWLRKASEHGVPQATNLLALLGAVPASLKGGCAAGSRALVRLVRPTPAMQALVNETALRVGVSPALLSSVITVESGFNPRAVSPKLAAGLMQLMPETAARFGVRDPFDPRDNLRAGATYLRSLLRLFDGNLTLALAAYNAGEERVLAHGGIPPFRETIDYVAAVRRLCACGE